MVYYVRRYMKKNLFLSGTFVSAIGIIIVKIIGDIYMIFLNVLIGHKGGTLYGYGYNIYMFFIN